MRDLPQQKIPRELCVGGDPAIFFMFPCSHGIFLWWDRSVKLKNTRRNATDQEKFKKTKKERMEERKIRDFFCGGSHTRVFSPSVRNALVWPSLRRTHSCEPPLQQASLTYFRVDWLSYIYSDYCNQSRKRGTSSNCSTSLSQVVKYVEPRPIEASRWDGTLDYPKLHVHVRRKQIRKSWRAQLDWIHQKPVHKIVILCKELSTLQAVLNKDNLGAGNSSRTGNGV